MFVNSDLSDLLRLFNNNRVQHTQDRLLIWRFLFQPDVDPLGAGRSSSVPSAARSIASRRHSTV